MPVDFEKKIVFFHITKCGGTTIERRFNLTNPENLYSRNFNQYRINGVYYAPQHLTPPHLYRMHPQTEAFDKFCIVRHPYERMVSDYFFMSRKLPRKGERYYRKFHNPQSSFSEFKFRTWLRTEAYFKHRDHYLEQWNYAQHIEKVFPLESIEDWMIQIDLMFGKNTGENIIIANKQSKTKEYAWNLSAPSKALIKRLYRLDFDNLGFDTT